MSNPSFDRNIEETQLVEYLIEQVVGRAAGRIQDVPGECWYNPPRDIYFVGNLRPLPDDPIALLTETASLRELRNKLAPMAFGADFRVQLDNDTAKVKVTVVWDCYYRIFPTLAQQREHRKWQATEAPGEDSALSDATAIVSETPTTSATMLPVVPDENNQDARTESDDSNALAEEQEKEENRVENESPEVIETSQDRRRERRARQISDSLFVRFRKIQCCATGQVKLEFDGTEWTVDWTDLRLSLDTETTRAQQIAMADADRLRCDSDPTAQITIPETALTSEQQYAAFLLSLKTPIIPEWKWQVSVKMRSNETNIATDQVLQIELINISPSQAPVSTNKSSRQRDNPNIEPFLFNTHAAFNFDGATVLPFELELAPRGFRYDRSLWGRGFNCAVERNTTNSTFSTTHTPVARQMRYTTRNSPPANFADLANNPLPVLSSIAMAMDDYLNDWRRQRAVYTASDTDWEEIFGSSFDGDQQQFEAEIAGFQLGCQLIRENADVRLAFQLTNESFRRAGDHPALPVNKRKTSWRLFQIVFLVSQIPGIVVLSNPKTPDVTAREQVDIIYFPTGGGKTEAYLATLVFHCFYDRLRGKAAGVTAWTRFPLRLLTLQQTQRVADVIGIAELVRREQGDARLSGKNIAGFAVGYFVGKEATPNEIINADQYQYARPEDKPFWSQANDAKARQNWKRVITCPACRTQTIRVDFDANTVRIDHRCTQPNCAFPNNRIPVYVVDNEIYRYLPSVIVGTIDKLASLGNQRKLAQVFGQVDGKCEKHGYYKGRCCQKDCRDDKLLKPGVPLGLSGPTLFIQDELHLLKEGLGTFDAHYETFTQQLQRRFGQVQPLKIIASSATIEAFARQVNHLYGRKRARVFPGLGPTLSQSFYAQTQDYPQRLFIGLLPHNKTIFNTILELIELYHRAIQRLQRLPSGSPSPYGGSAEPGTQQWFDILDPYVTSLTYFLASRELDSIRTDIKGDVIPNLERDGYVSINPQDLTGETSTDEVTRVLERLEQKVAPGKPAEAVLATNMVSHGVDIDRFNAMIFYGMPRQTAEYIQASSRAGRAHVGIVFACLHPARERDQSHYTYFSKYHEFIGQLVEPVAINRWAKFSLRRTMPGLFMAVLLQIMSNSGSEATKGGKYYMLDYIRQKISSGSIQADQFISILEDAYLVNSPTDVAEQTFRAEITQRVRMFLDQILSAGAACRYVSDALIPKPMTSLRDVDEALTIELDAAGTLWAQNNRS